LYDANTGLFFNAATKSWYSWNEKTQEYTIVGSNAKSDRDTERNANAAETKDKRPVVATVSSAPTTTTTTTTKSPATTDVADVHGVSLTIPQYRDRAKERRKLHGENALDRLVASAADGTQSAVQGRVTGGKIRAQRKRP
jgi:S-adenosylmethionine:diacylglycerol 3-amino-3-carboxypropyl transferase